MKVRSLLFTLATLAASLCLPASSSAFDPWGSSSFHSNWRSAPLTGFSSSSSSFERSPAPRVEHPTVNAGLHPAMFRASRIADSRALDRSTAKCWRFVKTALLESGSVSSYPQTTYAKQAGQELVSTYGFVKLRVRSPYQAPLGSVLVYGGRGAGHVELRTTTGFVSDYRAPRPCSLPFLGAFAKVGAPRTAEAAATAVPRS